MFQQFLVILWYLLLVAKRGLFNRDVTYMLYFNQGPLYVMIEWTPFLALCDPADHICFTCFLEKSHLGHAYKKTCQPRARHVWGMRGEVQEDEWLWGVFKVRMQRIGIFWATLQWDALLALRHRHCLINLESLQTLWLWLPIARVTLLFLACATNTCFVDMLCLLALRHFWSQL